MAVTKTTLARRARGLFWGMTVLIAGFGATNAAVAEELGKGDVDVLFHPFDPTLEHIATWLDEAQHSVDIAMYNLDVTKTSPVFSALASKAIQERIRSGELEVRMIYEGYSGVKAARKVSDTLEQLGVDVRWLASSRKVHHKFAVIDAGTDSARVISGSANWSLSSYGHYNENILFFDGLEGLASRFANEFDLLWQASSEYGKALSEAVEAPAIEPLEDGVSVVFNTANFEIEGKRMSINPDEPGYVLTRTVVDAIHSAKKSIAIATTRVNLRPIYNALVEAARPKTDAAGKKVPGVKVDLVVNMDQYTYESRRRAMKLESCLDEYDETCSKGVNFSHFLSLEDFPGHENITVRIKFFNLSPAAYLAKQMHSKYLIVDGRKVLSGSFNWSYSAEYDHIENLITLEGSAFPEAVAAFTADHERVFNMGREAYPALIKRLETAVNTGEKTDCSFEPMALTFAEIDYMLATAERLGKRNLRSFCKKN